MSRAPDLQPIKGLDVGEFIDFPRRLDGRGKPLLNTFYHDLERVRVARFACDWVKRSGNGMRFSVRLLDSKHIRCRRVK